MDKSEKGELSGNTSLPDIYTNEEKNMPLSLDTFAVMTAHFILDCSNII